MNEEFTQFLETVEERYREFVMELNEYLIQNQCKCQIKTAKSGYVVSYSLSETKKTLCTYVSRKTGMKLRIYPEHIAVYSAMLNSLPEPMKKDIKMASQCKRLINPADCNPRCPMGYVFMLDGEEHKKCRFMAFMPSLNREYNTEIKGLLEKELEAVRCQESFPG